MILAIDVGNTNIVLGCIEDGEILHIVRLHTDANQTDAEYAVKLKQLLDLYGVDASAFEGAIYSSVVPPINRAMLAAVKAVTGIDCMVVGPGIKTGLNLRVDDPGTVASDLVVGAVAAIQCYGAPALVMDLGTATTITVIDRDNGFRGGAIMPGVKLGMAALASGTSLLPDISITAPKKVIGTNTVDCMRSGLRHRRRARRHDRAHGGGAGLSLPPHRHRRSRAGDRQLLPARDRLRRRSAAQGPLDPLGEKPEISS